MPNSPLAVIETDAIGANVTIHEFAVIRRGVSIGDNVIIHPHTVIESGVILSEGVEVFPGAYVGKEPKGAGALARRPIFEPRIEIGANSSIGPHAVIYYDVIVGKNTLIGDGASIRERCRIGSKCVISRYVTVNYNTIIGDGTKIMDLTHITGNSFIGSNVFVSVCVATANDNSIGRDSYTDSMRGPVIEDGAMIGQGAILLPGVRIGSGAIVASGAVVTKDVQPETLVMGIPARLGKYIRFPESQ